MNNKFYFNLEERKSINDNSEYMENPIFDDSPKIMSNKKISKISQKLKEVEIEDIKRKVHIGNKSGLDL